MPAETAGASTTTNAKAAAARQLTGRQKAAALLISLGPDLSAQVLKHLREPDIETLTMEVVELEAVDEALRQQILEECFQMALARDLITSGGMRYAREILERAVGDQRAEEIMGRLLASRRPQRFQFVRDADPAQLVQLLSNEHPQTIALILSHLPPAQAAHVLINLATELRADVAQRIGTMGRTPPEVIDQVEDVLKRRFGSVLTSDYTSAGGTHFLVNVLTSVDRGTEKQILDYLDEENGELATEVRKLMFVFDDLVQLDNRSLQRVLREVDSKDLPLALRGASPELLEKVFRNQSSRAAEALRSEMELTGPVRLRQVEEAQQRIVSIVRRLDEAEEIVVQRGGEDALV